jgi:hypothetical protein
MQHRLFDIDAEPHPPANWTDTSREAADRIKGDTNRLRDLVYRAVHDSRSGATCDEVEASLGLSHQTASARVWELRRMGRIIDSNARRKTRSGRRAIVWIVKE